MSNKMTQEELAEKLNVSKLIELCNLFSCSIDQLIRDDLCISEEAYSDIRFETVPAFHYIRYAVVSMEPEEDAINHVRNWSNSLGIDSPEIIGWDFPVVSQEQINVDYMDVYIAVE